MLDRMSTKYFLFLMVMLGIFSVIGCGDVELSNPVDGIIRGDDVGKDTEEIVIPDADPDGIVWGDDDDLETLPERNPVVSLVRTEITRLGETEILFHIETDSEVQEDLIIALEICYVGNQEDDREIFVMAAGEDTSEKFSFGEDILEVRVLPYETILSLDERMTPINSEEGKVNIKKYPIQERRYGIDPEGEIASRNKG